MSKSRVSKSLHISMNFSFLIFPYHFSNQCKNLNLLLKLLFREYYSGIFREISSFSILSISFPENIILVYRLSEYKLYLLYSMWFFFQSSLNNCSAQSLGLLQKVKASKTIASWLLGIVVA